MTYTGEAPRNANSARIYYGLLKEPDYNSFQGEFLAECVVALVFVCFYLIILA